MRETTDRLTNSLNSTQKAVNDLIESYGEDYPNGKRFLSDIAAYREKLLDATFDDLDSLSQEIESLQRSALIQNPLVQNNSILFVARNQYRSDHHSTATLFQNGEINTNSFRGKSALKTFDPRTGETSVLVDCPQGVVRDPEIHFDGNRAVFSMRRSKEDDYHIYELNLKTGDLRQITDGPEISDFDPVYLPDGDIVFRLDPRAQILPVQPAYHGQPLPHERRRRRHPPNRPQHALRRPSGSYARRPFALRPLGIRRQTFRPRLRPVDQQPGRNQPTCSITATTRGRPAPSLTRAPFPIRIASSPPSVLATTGPGAPSPSSIAKSISTASTPSSKVGRRILHPTCATTRITGTGTVRNHPRGGQIDTFRSLPVKYEDPFPLSDRYFLCSRSIEGERMGDLPPRRLWKRTLYPSGRTGLFRPHAGRDNADASSHSIARRLREKIRGSSTSPTSTTAAEWIKSPAAPSRRCASSKPR